MAETRRRTDALEMAIRDLIMSVQLVRRLYLQVGERNHGGQNEGKNLQWRVA